MGITISQKEISLDLQNQGFVNTIYAQQGDSDSRQLVVSLFDDGEKYRLCKRDFALSPGSECLRGMVGREIRLSDRVGGAW